VPFLASSHQVPTMHSHTVGNGRIHLSKPYQLPTPVSHNWNPAKLEPITNNPNKVRPVNSMPEMFGSQELVKTTPQKTPASALPQAGPSPLTRFPSPPQNTIPAQVLGIPAGVDTESAPMNSSPFPIPSCSGPFPGSSTPNKLRSPRSVFALAGAC
jgi:hypothetical protein